MTKQTEVLDFTINKLTKEQYQQLVDSESVSDTELYFVDDGTEYITRQQLDTKQDKLIAGDSIKIEDSNISVSVFDKSKFTVVGNPIVTDDGIASGFSSSNYLKNIPSSYVAGHKLRVEFEYTPKSINTSNVEILFSVLGLNNTRPIYIARYQDSHIHFSIGSNYKVTETLNVNKSYKFIYETDELSYCRLYINENSYDLPIATALSENEKTFLSYAIMKNCVEARTVLGSTDLKQFSIEVDGIEVFNGTQTLHETLENKVNKSDNEIITGVKTFSNAGYGYGGVTINNTDGGASCIKFMSKGVKKGLIGVDASEKPIFENGATTIHNLVRNTRNTATGSATRPVYIDANGIVQPITSYEGTSTKALQDGNGNNIVNTYATKTELSSKQNQLTAGENIIIEGNVISATGGGSGGSSGCIQLTQFVNGDIINVQNDITIYKVDVNSNRVLQFDLSELDLDTNTCTFELKINMTKVSTVTFNERVYWQNNQAPTFLYTGTYYLVFRTDNGGASWMANSQGYWAI